jgi:hypothetical protein
MYCRKGTLGSQLLLKWSNLKCSGGPKYNLINPKNKRSKRDTTNKKGRRKMQQKETQRDLK